MGLPGENSNLKTIIKKKTKFKKFWILNFVLVSSLPQCSLHFPLLRTLKSYFLYVKIFLNFVLKTPETISYRLKYFWIFVLEALAPGTPFITTSTQSQAISEVITMSLHFLNVGPTCRTHRRKRVQHVGPTFRKLVFLGLNAFSRLWKVF